MRFFTLARNPSQRNSQLEKKFQNQKKSREQLQNPNRLGISRAATRNSKIEKSQFFKISLEIQNEIMPNRLGISRAATRNSKIGKSQFFKILLEIQNEIIKAPTMNECEEARGLRSFAFQKDSNYSKNLLERSVQGISNFPTRNSST